MKTCFALVLGMLFASSALAQTPDKPNEFFVGIGDAGLIFEIEEVVGTVFSLGAVRYGNQEGGYQIVAGYQRRLGRWASAGVTGSWAGSKKTVYYLSRSDRIERQLLTLMADGRAHWLRKPNVELYSGIALGVSNLGDEWLALAKKDDLTTLGFHVIPIGMRVGRDVGAFLETGAGFHGFLKAGVSARL